MRIIISGMTAVGKSTLVQTIASRHNLRNCSAGELLKQIAKRHGYNAAGSYWWETEEGSEFNEERKTNSEFDKELDGLLKEILDEDNIILAAWAMPWTYNNEECVKIWLKAPADIRAKRMMKRDKISYNQAQKSIMTRDNNDRKLLFDLYGIQLEKDLSPFDMVLDTRKLSATDVGSVILNYLSRLPTTQGSKAMR
jgi:cytidylate kinase